MTLIVLDLLRLVLLLCVWSVLVSVSALEKKACSAVVGDGASYVSFRSRCLVMVFGPSLCFLLLLCPVLSVP